MKHCFRVDKLSLTLKWFKRFLIWVKTNSTKCLLLRCSPPQLQSWLCQLHEFTFFFPSRGCVWVCPGFRQRLTTIPWKSETDPQPRLHWSANTTAPKHLISWFPHPTSCSCCSPQTTAAPRRASVSDMRVRLIEVFGRPTKIHTCAREAWMFVMWSEYTP